MNGITRRLPVASVLLALALAASGLMGHVSQAQGQITSPEKFFGF